MAAAEHKSDFKFTKDTPYLTLTGELWGVSCEDFGEKWSCYNGTELYEIWAILEFGLFKRWSNAV